AGIGSTIVVPVVMNLQSGVTVKSYQFRVEVAPVNSGRALKPGFSSLSFTTNDFIPLAGPNAANSLGIISNVSYTIGKTSGLQVTAIGTNAHISFQNFAVVALLKVPMPNDAVEGDTYSVRVLYPSATSDGINTAVSLTAMSAATISIVNHAYLVGDSASSFGAWYNAGGFGNGDLDNADVN